MWPPPYKLPPPPQHDDADENRGAEKNGDGDNDVGRLGKILASRLTMAPPPPQGARAGSREEVQASPSAGTNIRTDSVWRLAATSRERAGVCSEGGGQDGGHEGHFGLGAAGGGVDDVDVADTAGMDKQVGGASGGEGSEEYEERDGACVLLVLWVCLPL